MPSPPFAEWKARLLLVVFSTGLSLACGELAARTILRPQNLWWVEGTRTREVSPSLGWRLRPGASERIHREDFEVTISVNSSGLRGREVPYQPAPGRRRLAIMGDSFAFGFYVEESETLGSRLDRALEPCQIDVVNAGVPGYSTDQQWLYFNEEIWKYQPSEVLLVFFANDLTFNVQAEVSGLSKPVFVWHDDVLELIPPEPRAESAVPPRLTPITFRHSALWQYFAMRLQRRRPDWAQALAKIGLAPEMSTNLPEVFLPYAFKNAEEEARVDEMWKRTAELLEGFRGDVHRRGAGFSVLYAPASYEVNDLAWLTLQRRYEPWRTWRRDAVQNRLTSLLGELGVPLIEATRVFAAAEKTLSPAYLPIDGHWNARGNEIASQILLPRMRGIFGCGS